MLRKVLLSLSATVLVASPAYAVDQQILLTADVAGVCSIDGILAPENDAAVLAISPLGEVSTSQKQFQYTVLCNTSADFSLISQKGGLVETTNSAAKIDYAATAVGPFNDLNINTTFGAPDIELVDGPNRSSNPNGLATVSITPHAGQTPPAGEYEDIVIFRVEPAP
jgi:hypothetical protein